MLKPAELRKGNPHVCNAGLVRVAGFVSGADLNLLETCKTLCVLLLVPVFFFLSLFREIK